MTAAQHALPAGWRESRIYRTAARLKGLLFHRQTYVVLERALELREASTLVLPGGVRLEIARGRGAVEEWRSSGYDLEALPPEQVLEACFEAGNVLFVAVHRTVVCHSSWVGFEDARPCLDEVLRRVEAHSAVLIGPCTTKPDYRGQGIYPGVLGGICVWASETGFRRALISSRVSNESSLRGIAKVGFRARGTVVRRTLLGRTSWSRESSSGSEAGS